MNIPIITLILFGLVILWAVATYNRLIKLKNMVKEAWSGIDVQLKRRFNLIPNLVATTKGYASHETSVLEKLAAVRAGSQEVNERGAQEGQVSRAIQNLLAVAEAYPDLKASRNFVDLQNKLDGVENEIQLARRYYNGAVRDLNILIESFPSNLVAQGFGFRNADFFEIELATQRDLPKVEF